MSLNINETYTSKEILEYILKSSKKDLEDNKALVVGILIHDNTNVAINKLYEDKKFLKALSRYSGDLFKIYLLKPNSDIDEEINSFTEDWGLLDFIPESEKALDNLTDEILSTMFPDSEIKLPSLVFFGTTDENTIFYFSRYLGGYNKEELFEYLSQISQYTKERLKEVDPKFYKNKDVINIELEKGSQQIVNRLRIKNILRRFPLFKKVITKVSMID